MAEEEEPETCAVCLDALEDKFTVKLKCGHQYHTHCIECTRLRWLIYHILTYHHTNSFSQSKHWVFYWGSLMLNIEMCK
jgi:Ring finger domain